MHVSVHLNLSAGCSLRWGCLKQADHSPETVAVVEFAVDQEPLHQVHVLPTGGAGAAQSAASGGAGGARLRRRSQETRQEEGGGVGGGGGGGGLFYGREGGEIKWRVRIKKPEPIGNVISCLFVWNSFLLLLLLFVICYRQ